MSLFFFHKRDAGFSDHVSTREKQLFVFVFRLVVFFKDAVTWSRQNELSGVEKPRREEEKPEPQTRRDCTRLLRQEETTQEAPPPSWRNLRSQCLTGRYPQCLATHQLLQSLTACELAECLFFFKHNRVFQKPHSEGTLSQGKVFHFFFSSAVFSPPVARSAGAHEASEVHRKCVLKSHASCSQKISLWSSG